MSQEENRSIWAALTNGDAFGARRAGSTGPSVIPGSKEEAELKQREKAGFVVTDRRPFECERCMWRSAATAIRSCKRCHWCEPGSKEEAKMIEEVRFLSNTL
jgi:hypothetical protein